MLTQLKIIFMVAIINVRRLKTITALWAMIHVTGQYQSLIQFIIWTKPIIGHAITLGDDSSNHRGSRTLTTGDQN
jgi:hypothetical protein